ncbi:HNH endonuclease [Acidithiobacillus ferrooxidans]|uniref:RNA-guided endonuclease IscB n=1 Tax=Acidithiobacillus ferrooxidans TaxID=920 RepID=UPI001C06A122|nr:RNA-guided endonuclease IscB [Acidithiobacillus ferrooxidans]MBU2774232.1 HNH endonuclease [Acidithiobacillus ferrooxidans]
MQRVLVLDRNRQPLMPCHPARARELLREGKAAVFRRYPFTIILQEREGGETQETRLKLDPGSKVTGMALVADCTRRGKVVVWAAELEHRGDKIRMALHNRWSQRRSRRSRKTRYRPARFRNRRRPEGWLAPSLQHRVDTTMTWVQRLMRWTPVAGISTMLHRFDTQAMQNPEISGTEYQRGELLGYEVREYLLEKWGRKCAYCDAGNLPLTIDHIHPKSTGGSDRVSNLALACFPCNQRKSNRDVAEFLAHDPKRLARIEAQRKAPLRDAAAVNATRNILFGRLLELGLPIETGSGGRTRFNRSQQGYPKAHWIDAACVEETGECVRLNPEYRPLQITATGHGRRQMQNMTKKGFPRGKAKSRQKIYFGFQTGDMVRAVVPRGRFEGTHVGRVACKKSGNFKLKANGKEMDGVSWRHCTPIHRADGYAYAH